MQIDGAGSTSLIVGQVTLSAMVAYAIEFMKRSKYFPWLTKEKTALLRVLSGVGSSLAAVGIGTASKWNAGDHTWTIAISGLCLSCIIHSGYALARSWLFTQMIYDGVISKKSIGDPLPVAAVPAPAMPAINAQGKNV
jgi:hypothetical protein